MQHRKFKKGINDLLWQGENKDDYGFIGLGDVLYELQDTIFPDKSLEDIKNMPDDEYIKQFKEYQMGNYWEYDDGEMLKDYMDRNDITMDPKEFLDKMINSKQNEANILKDKELGLKNLEE